MEAFWKRSSAGAVAGSTCRKYIHRQHLEALSAAPELKHAGIVDSLELVLRYCRQYPDVAELLDRRELLPGAELLLHATGVTDQAAAAT